MIENTLRMKMKSNLGHIHTLTVTVLYNTNNSNTNIISNLTGFPLTPTLFVFPFALQVTTLAYTITKHPFSV